MQPSQASVGTSDGAHPELPIDARRNCTHFVQKVKGLRNIPYLAPRNDLAPRPGQPLAELWPMRLDTLASFVSPGYATMRDGEWGVCPNSIAAHLASRRLLRSRWRIQLTRQSRPSTSPSRAR
jgi:hypothetical protein